MVVRSALISATRISTQSCLEDDPVRAHTAHRTLLRCICATALIGAPCAHAQETATQPSEAASAPTQATATPASLLRSVGTFLSGIVPSTNASPGQPASAAEGADAAAHPAQPTAGPVPFNVIDIETWSRTADVVLDPQCKTLVQPFGITDNLASLGMLAVKLKIAGLFDRLQDRTHPAPKIHEIVKLAARNLNWLPTYVELRIGEQLIPEADIIPEDKNADSRRVYQQARAMLADIVAQLPQPLPYQFRALVRTTSFGQATALPGGIILMDRDLFKKDSAPDYAYFIISHEVAHVLQRHETRAYQARLADGIDKFEDLQRFLNKTSDPDTGTVVGYVSALKKLIVDFSEQQELQADSCAVQMLQKRHPEPAAMAEAMRVIEQRLGPILSFAADGPQSTQALDQFKYLANGVFERHPDSAKRRANLHATFQIRFGLN